MLGDCSNRVRNTVGNLKTAPPRPIPPTRQVNTGVEPRPWTTRKPGECAFPVGGMGADTLSCCAPTGRTGDVWQYCPVHLAVMTQRAVGGWSNEGIPQGGVGG